MFEPETVSSWSLIFKEGDREFWLDPDSRLQPEPSDPGHLIHAAVSVAGDWREQTIWEPAFLSRRPDTIRRRLRTLTPDAITPQVLVR